MSSTVRAEPGDKVVDLSIIQTQVTEVVGQLLGGIASEADLDVNHPCLGGRGLSLGLQTRVVDHYSKKVEWTVCCNYRGIPALSLSSKA